jgi:hypothetical protein
MCYHPPSLLRRAHPRKFPRALCTILQILSLAFFEKTQLNKFLNLEDAIEYASK